MVSTGDLENRILKIINDLDDEQPRQEFSKKMLNLSVRLSRQRTEDNNCFSYLPAIACVLRETFDKLIETISMENESFSPNFHNQLQNVLTAWQKYSSGNPNNGDFTKLKQKAYEVLNSRVEWFNSHKSSKLEKVKKVLAQSPRLVELKEAKTDWVADQASRFAETKWALSSYVHMNKTAKSENWDQLYIQSLDLMIILTGIVINQNPKERRKQADIYVSEDKANE